MSLLANHHVGDFRLAKIEEVELQSVPGHGRPEGDFFMQRFIRHATITTLLLISVATTLPAQQTYLSKEFIRLGKPHHAATTTAAWEVGGIVTPQAYGGLSLRQTFAYDKLNRLGTAVETGGSNEWSQTYGPKGAAGAADAFGNHWVSAGTTLSSFTPTASSNFTNNQLFIQNSGYDAAGNQKAIGGLNNVPAYSFTYDAENRQSGATFPSGTATYSYDGEGRRVMKVTGGVTTVYVYDPMGEVAAEYSTNRPRKQARHT